MVARSVENVLLRSWQLLRANWWIVVPGLVFGFVAGVASELLAPSRGSLDGAPLPQNVPASIASALTSDAVAIVATVLSIAYTTGMANAAWERGAATFLDGRRAFFHEGGHVLVAVVGLAVLGVVAAVAAPYTAYVSLLAYVFFGIYTMPAAVVGELRGLAAIAESARVAYGRPVQTLLLVLAVAAVAALLGVVDALLGATPFLGSILAAVALQAVIAYVTLVVVGEYRAQRQQGTGPSSPAGAA